MNENYILDYGAANTDYFEHYYLSGNIFAIVEIINVLIFVIDAAVILKMFLRCRKFERTKVYEDFAGSGKLARVLEVIVIFLFLDAIYGLTRLFGIIDVINEAKRLFSVFPTEIFIIPIALIVAVPVLSCAASIYVWNLYHNTKKTFFFLYPNGVKPVTLDKEPKKVGECLYGTNTSPDLTYERAKVSAGGIGSISDDFDNFQKAAAGGNSETRHVQKDEDFFGTGASIDSLMGVGKAEEEKMKALLMRDEPIPAAETDDISSLIAASDDEGKTEDSEESIFGTGGTFERLPTEDLNSADFADMLADGGDEETSETDLRDEGGIFGSGTSEEYMKKFTSADEAVIKELLVQEETETISDKQ